MPANLTSNKTAIREAVVKLLGFISDNSEVIAMTLDHFPSPNEKLTFPAVTVAAKSPQFTPLMPYVIAKGAVVDVSVQPEDPDADPVPPDRQSTVQRVVGMYDFSFQLDIWTAYKPQRDSLVEEIIKIFNLNSENHGIDVQLTNYFNQWCHFSLDVIQYLEDEASSQRGEWRAIITVLGNTRCVIEKVEHLAETIENTLETPPNITPSTSQNDELII